MWLPESKWGHLNAVKSRLQDPHGWKYSKIYEPILAEHLKIKKKFVLFPYYRTYQSRGFGRR